MAWFPCCVEDSEIVNSALTPDVSGRQEVNTVCPGPTDTPLLKQLGDASPGMWEALVCAIGDEAHRHTAGRGPCGGVDELCGTCSQGSKRGKPRRSKRATGKIELNRGIM